MKCMAFNGGCREIYHGKLMAAILAMVVFIAGSAQGYEPPFAECHLLEDKQILSFFLYNRFAPDAKVTVLDYFTNYTDVQASIGLDTWDTYKAEFNYHGSNMVLEFPNYFSPSNGKLMRQGQPTVPVRCSVAGLRQIGAKCQVCFGQVTPDGFCRAQCGCSTAFCGAW